MKAPLFSVYNLVLALWVGGISIFTFIVTPAIFRSYGRDQAGEIVGKLFPGYFQIYPGPDGPCSHPVLFYCRRQHASRISAFSRPNYGGACDHPVRRFLGPPDHGRGQKNRRFI